MKPNGKPQSFYLARALIITMDLLIFILAVATIVFIEFFMENTKRGFFCGDTSIGFKYQKDTISIKAIIIYSLTPIVVLCLVEFIFHTKNSNEEEFSSVPLKAVAAWKKSLRWFCDYGINLVLMLLVMDSSKVFIGSHRPHFLHTCQPDAAINCTKGDFITEYKCTNPKYTDPSCYSLRDNSRSFPSGHASITMYASVFLIWYLHCRVPKIQSLFLIPFLQSLLMIWTCFCCLSRITDHRHHWYDVVGGALLGVFFAIYTCYIISRKFDDGSKTNVTQSTSTNNNQQQRLLTIIAKDEQQFTMNNLE